MGPLAMAGISAGMGLLSGYLSRKKAVNITDPFQEQKKRLVGNLEKTAYETDPNKFLSTQAYDVNVNRSMSGLGSALGMNKNISRSLLTRNLVGATSDASRERAFNASALAAQERDSARSQLGNTLSTYSRQGTEIDRLNKMSREDARRSKSMIIPRALMSGFEGYGQASAMQESNKLAIAQGLLDSKNINQRQRGFDYLSKYLAT